MLYILYKYSKAYLKLSVHLFYENNTGPDLLVVMSMLLSSELKVIRFSKIKRGTRDLL